MDSSILYSENSKISVTHSANNSVRNIVIVLCGSLSLDSNHETTGDDTLVNFT